MRAGSFQLSTRAGPGEIRRRFESEYARRPCFSAPPRRRCDRAGVFAGHAHAEGRMTGGAADTGRWGRGFARRPAIALRRPSAPRQLGGCPWTRDLVAAIRSRVSFPLGPDCIPRRVADSSDGRMWRVTGEDLRARFTVPNSGRRSERSTGCGEGGWPRDLGDLCCSPATSQK